MNSKQTPHASATRHKPWHAVQAHATRLYVHSRAWLQSAKKQSRTADEASLEKQHEQEVKEGLEAIYASSGEGSDDNVYRLDRRPSFAWIGKGFFCLVLLAGFGYGLSRSTEAAKWFGLEKKTLFRVTMAGSSEITIGKEEEFTIIWDNAGDQEGQSLQIRLGIPQEFRLTATEPPLSNKETLQWTIGTVRPWSQGIIRIKGVFIGALGQSAALQSMATYYAGRDQDVHEAIAVKTVTLRDSVLTGNVIVPLKVMSGDIVALRYVVTNRGDQALDDLVAHIGLPQGFVLLDTGGNPMQTDVRDYYFPLKTLTAGAFDTVQITGIFSPGFAGDAVLKTEVGRRGKDHLFFAAQSVETRLPLVSGDLALAFVINGTDQNQILDPGGRLRLGIGYQNTSPEILKNITLRLAFESFVDGKTATGTSLLDWSRLEQRVSGVTSTFPRIQMITFGPAQISGLAALPPLNEGTVELQIPTRMAPSGTRDAWIRVSLKGEIGKIGETDAKRTVLAQPILVRNSSHVVFSEEARYFTEEGAPIGFGPLPPVVGTTTAYRVYWRVKKSMHPLQAIEVIATLPRAVEWGEKATSTLGSIVFEQQTRTIRWKIPVWPEDEPETEASFDVQLRPSSADEGRFALLLNEARFEATDALLQETMVRQLPIMTTDLQTDEGARFKGVVKTGK